MYVELCPPEACFDTREWGGPRVLPPTRKGFGSVILFDAAQQYGIVTMNYLPDGLLYQLQLDLKEIETPDNVVALPIAPIQRPAWTDAERKLLAQAEIVAKQIKK